MFKYRCIYKKTVAVLLLVIFASWSQGIFTNCYGSDWHLECAPPETKASCSKSQQFITEIFSGVSDFNSCGDIPVKATYHIVFRYRTTSFKLHFLTPFKLSQISVFPINQLCEKAYPQHIPPLYSPFNTSLKGVILRI